MLKPWRTLTAASVLVLLTIAPAAFAQQQVVGGMAEGLPNLRSSFSRTFENPVGRDSVAGEFFYLQPHTFYLEVEHPLHQIMVIDNERNLTTVYYPDKKRAFIFEGERPAMLPIVSGILAAIQPDYGLSTLGFEIYDQAISADTLVTHWRHPQADDSVGEFTLAQTGNRLTSATLTLPTTDGRATTRFHDYVTDGPYDIPVVIETETVNIRGRALERLTFPDLEVSPQIPPHVRNFQIPDDASVEHKRW